MIPHAAASNVVAVGKCRAALRPWRRGGRLHATLIVKATLAFDAQGALSATAPLPLAGEDRHRDGVMTSLLAASDMALFRPRADVLLVGQAHAPAPTTQCHVRMTLTRGPEVLMSKRLLVRGEQRNGEPVPFASMPLDFEHAYGGPGHPANPIGRGIGPGPQPTVLDPADAKRVASYGPVPVRWPRRRDRLTAAARAALADEGATVAEPFDWSFFQAAPADQQAAYLRGSETVMLEGLHAETQHLRLTLPNIRAGAAAYALDGVPYAEVELHADTLLIEPDEGRLSLVWRGIVRPASEASLQRATFTAAVALGDREPVLPAEPPEHAPAKHVAADIPLNETVMIVDEETIALQEMQQPPLDGSFTQTVKLSELAKEVARDDAPYALAEPRRSGASTPDRPTPLWRHEGSVQRPLPEQAVTTNLDAAALNAEIEAAKQRRLQAAHVTTPEPIATPPKPAPIAASPEPIAVPPAPIAAPPAPTAAPPAPEPARPAAPTPVPIAASPPTAAKSPSSNHFSDWLAEFGKSPSPPQPPATKLARPAIPRGGNVPVRLYSSLGKAIKKPKKR